MRFNLISLDRPIRSDIYFWLEVRHDLIFKMQTDSLIVSELQTDSRKSKSGPPRAGTRSGP